MKVLLNFLDRRDTCVYRDVVGNVTKFIYKIWHVSREFFRYDDVNTVGIEMFLEVFKKLFSGAFSSGVSKGFGF